MGITFSVFWTVLGIIIIMFSVFINDISRIMTVLIQLYKKKLRGYDIESNGLIMRTTITEIWQKSVKQSGK